MKPHPRIRKTIKWGGAVVTVLLATCLICTFATSVSAPNTFVVAGWNPQSKSGHIFSQMLVLHRGRVVWARANFELPTVGDKADILRRTPRDDSAIAACDLRLAGWAELFVRYVTLWGETLDKQRNDDAAFRRFDGVGWVLAVPAWATRATISVFLLIALLGACRAWKSPKVGFCAKCNYDRTGLAAGAVCPECGAGAIGVEDSAARA